MSTSTWCLRSKGTKNNALAVQFCEQNLEIADKLSVGFSSFILGIESLDRSKGKELKDKRASNRLRLATTRVKNAEGERIGAIAKAHAEGLSIRTTAKVTGLSSSHVHQPKSCLYMMRQSCVKAGGRGFQGLECDSSHSPSRGHKG